MLLFILWNIQIPRIDIIMSVLCLMSHISEYDQIIEVTRPL